VTIIFCSKLDANLICHKSRVIVLPHNLKYRHLHAKRVKFTQGGKTPTSKLQAPENLQTSTSKSVGVTVGYWLSAILSKPDEAWAIANSRWFDYW
jgi:hypothetical protein